MHSASLNGPSRAPLYDAIVVSDLHLRAGHGDDFVFDAQFEALVAHAQAEGCHELIFNGDTFEFVAMWPEALAHPDPGLGFTELESLARLSAIARAHARAFEALRRFVAHGGRCVFLPGNHDWDLHWPQVRAQLRALLGDPDGRRVRFVLHGEPYRPAQGKLHIEHGHQLVGDQNLFLHPARPIRPDPLGGPPRLEQPIGNHLVRTLVNPLERHFPFINNVRPFLKVRWLAPGHQSARLLRLLADAALRLTDDHRILRRLKEILLHSSPLRLFSTPALPNPHGRREFVTSDLQSILGDDSTHQLRQAARQHLQAGRGTSSWGTATIW
jgi:UDP-2,3-diacylglucosamine pyrophosphatase LpxH